MDSKCCFAGKNAKAVGGRVPRLEEDRVQDFALASSSGTCAMHYATPMVLAGFNFIFTSYFLYRTTP